MRAAAVVVVLALVCASCADDRAIRARALGAQGRHDASIKLYREVLSESPDDPEVVGALESVLAAASELHLGRGRTASAARPQEALEAYRRALEYGSDPAAIEGAMQAAAGVRTEAAARRVVTARAATAARDLDAAWDRAREAVRSGPRDPASAAVFDRVADRRLEATRTARRAEMASQLWRVGEAVAAARRAHGSWRDPALAGLVARLGHLERELAALASAEAAADEGRWQAAAQLLQTVGPRQPGPLAHVGSHRAHAQRRAASSQARDRAQAAEQARRPWSAVAAWRAALATHVLPGDARPGGFIARHRDLMAELLEVEAGPGASATEALVRGRLESAVQTYGVVVKRAPDHPTAREGQVLGRQRLAGHAALRAARAACARADDGPAHKAIWEAARQLPSSVVQGHARQMLTTAQVRKHLEGAAQAGRGRRWHGVIRELLAVLRVNPEHAGARTQLTQALGSIDRAARLLDQAMAAVRGQRPDAERALSMARRSQAECEDYAQAALLVSWLGPYREHRARLAAGAAALTRRPPAFGVAVKAFQAAHQALGTDEASRSLSRARAGARGAAALARAHAQAGRGNLDGALSAASEAATALTLSGVEPITLRARTLVLSLRDRRAEALDALDASRAALDGRRLDRARERAARARELWSTSASIDAQARHVERVGKQSQALWRALRHSEAEGRLTVAAAQLEALEQITILGLEQHRLAQRIGQQLRLRDRLVDRARRAAAAGRNYQALKLLDHALVIDPEHPSAVEARADLAGDPRLRAQIYHEELQILLAIALLVVTFYYVLPVVPPREKIGVGSLVDDSGRLDPERISQRWRTGALLACAAVGLPVAVGASITAGVLDTVLPLPEAARGFCRTGAIGTTAALAAALGFASWVVLPDAYARWWYRRGRLLWEWILDLLPSSGLVRDLLLWVLPLGPALGVAVAARSQVWLAGGLAGGSLVISGLSFQYVRLRNRLNRKLAVGLDARVEVERISHLGLCGRDLLGLNVLQVPLLGLLFWATYPDLGVRWFDAGGSPGLLRSVGYVAENVLHTQVFLDTFEIYPALEQLAGVSHRGLLGVAFIWWVRLQFDLLLLGLAKVTLDLRNTLDDMRADLDDPRQAAHTEALFGGLVGLPAYERWRQRSGANHP